ncbi:hypothetical protein IGX41_09555 [Bacillus velezensis]|nr:MULTISPECIES: hypothetical protein [Bacillus]MBD8887998.1 hypothetical protein [Bacillus velezensis]MBR7817166.1 hypothetical protein [Bacillus sp. CCNWLCWHY013]MCP9019121.1 hypothetical protein [Bacillus velezensis]MDE5155713.1 hypothetical protein [Bacillus amyloliquefaciens]MDK2557879.1 hypothetical protein [Bacillus amyloliquefaciens]
MIGLVQPSGAVKKKKITVKRKKKTLVKRRKKKRSIIIHAAAAAAAAAVIGNRSHKPVLQIDFSCSPNSGCCLGFFIKISTK